VRLTRRSSPASRRDLARTYRWVTVWLIAGAVLALLLLANSIRDYRFVSRLLTVQQVRQELSQYMDRSRFGRRGRGGSLSLLLVRPRRPSASDDLGIERLDPATLAGGRGDRSAARRSGRRRHLAHPPEPRHQLRRSAGSARDRRDRGSRLPFLRARQAPRAAAGDRPRGAVRAAPVSPGGRRARTPGDPLRRARGPRSRPRSIKPTVDTYGRWLPMGNEAAVDRLDEGFVTPEEGSPPSLPAPLPQPRESDADRLRVDARPLAHGSRGA